MTVIKRYLSDENLKRMEKDFAFLLARVGRPAEEMRICLRDDYFNIYFKGNSLAKVEFRSADNYRVSMHKEFIGASLDGDSRFTLQKSDASEYCVIDVKGDLVHPLLQSQHLREWCSNISRRHFSEELAFEQLLISDNASNPDVLFVDRQVCDLEFKRRMDLLVLRRDHEDSGKLGFQVVEIKIGNNPELLDGRVLEQINAYLEHLSLYLNDYRACYEKNLSQQWQLGLLKKPSGPVLIGDEVSGCIAVTGYRGVAEPVVRLLMKQPAASVPFKVQFREFYNTL